MLADAAFEIVGRAISAFAALNVDDRAERALIRAAAAEIDAGKGARGAADVLFREDRHRFFVKRRQVVHAVIERLQGAVPGVAQYFVEAALLGLAGKERDPDRLRFLQL